MSLRLDGQKSSEDSDYMSRQMTASQQESVTDVGAMEWYGAVVINNRGVQLDS